MIATVHPVSALLAALAFPLVGIVGSGFFAWWDRRGEQ